MILYSTQPTVGHHCQERSDGKGWTWTLVQRLGVLLREAEERFGPRDRDWTLLGIEFGGAAPAIWYPGNVQHVAIKLSDSAGIDPARALFQLAHETIHLLSPSGAQQAPAIEEGLATLFSQEIARRFDLPYAPGAPAYLHCRDLVATLLDLHPDGVRTLREREPAFYRLRPETIRATFDDVPETLATALCEPFSDIQARMAE